ncbi:cytochrome c biogenesis heme-transporting ATPase CcmA [Legionella jordanis]|uniref:Heme exporter protein CcmA n=1 Tax=Legionella jordanis TaxID=456 RepID=A0A0W0VFF8_9GAMM|nr:cytochrome c biogenesis heme-transporting ATPase CcmA [Legionella jordanis]KTD18885.1 heme exporter protein CcmA [Legionella jordanis]RMX05592.1 cytochrome c biogenesis heme-transporting ATPase CcmA [Legionella jordanis]RMX19265.1 cytochrome c biogenesis heme-transporting ATPase CcmA [Legionella jordanis]VEH12985.1 heme exporter protein CcmA [Legionella jordanis]HAT8714028.1 cytochrome c biogenesis heme-transporting ATPase CcmA [Legionella jordanis]
MLEVISLSFDYQDKPVLDQVEFAVKPGELLHLRGGNGAGKTTLLRLLTGLLEPSTGDIRYQGDSIYKDLSAYQRNLCFVGHRTGINPFLTVRENCFFDLQWGRRGGNFEDLLQHYGLSDFADECCSHLSAGQRRRVGLLRTAISNAKLWLLDEPLVALDQQAMKVFMGSLESHLLEGGQVIMSSHQDLKLKSVPQLEYAL